MPAYLSAAPCTSLAHSTRNHVAALMLGVTCQPVTSMRHSGDPDDPPTVLEVLLEVTHGPCCI